MTNLSYEHRTVLFLCNVLRGLIVGVAAAHIVSSNCCCDVM